MNLIHAALLLTTLSTSNVHKVDAGNQPSDAERQQNDQNDDALSLQDRVCNATDQPGIYKRLLSQHSFPISDYSFGDISSRYDRSSETYTCMIPFIATTVLAQGKINVAQVKEALARLEKAPEGQDKQKAAEFMNTIKNAHFYESGTMIVSVSPFYHNGEIVRLSSKLIEIDPD